MKTTSIRQQFLHYFKNQQHAIIASSPVVPHEDPTLLFNNAGMNQFKDVFLGKSVRDYVRATTSQKCIRAGGKHNDLENVGHTKRHLTFFEMLGNFSFGDYFKEEAIKYAWEVSTQVFGFDAKRIWPTVYKDDDEAFAIWTRYVPKERITRFGEKENFWAMGDTGPCGPCSELLYDRGPGYGSATNPLADTSGERFLEFWNLVFMQYNRQSSGKQDPLPKPSIDTGAGLERVMSLIEDVDSVFETDILRGLIAEVENTSGIVYDVNHPHTAPAFRVIADHLRCLAFAIADGAQPSNVERGYVLRKILRRAVRYGRILGFNEPFLARILPRLINTMGDDYHELKKAQTRIAEILTSEEEVFIRTLKRGGNILSQIMEKAQEQGNTISGDDAFKLKDTYGLPIEEISLLAKDGGLIVDTVRYQELEVAAKERSRSVHKTTHQIAGDNLFADYVKLQGSSEFLGYALLSSPAKITALVVDGQFVDQMKEGDEGIVLLDKTPFYPEMGGQVGDTGVLKSDQQLFVISNTQAPFKGVIAHIGKLEKGRLQKGESLLAEVERMRRQKIANNHTATHLLHWALTRLAGEQIKQAGSVVEPTRLRFDFSHHKALTAEEILQLEDLVNHKIRENLPVKSYEMAYEEAQKRQDIKQFFGEKYANKVRVIDIDYSKELCGGTHTSALGNIGLFRITKESSIAAGVRRIEAVTGEEAEAFSRQSDRNLQAASALLKTKPDSLTDRIETLLEENRKLATELKAVKKKELEVLVDDLIAKSEMIKNVPFIVEELALTPEELRECAEWLVTKMKSAIVVLAGRSEDKGHLLVRVTDDLVSKGYQANAFIKAISPIIEGSGGGKPNNAQAGGKAPHKIPEALKEARKLILSHRSE